MCGSSPWQNQQPCAVIAFLRGLSRTKDGIVVLQHLKAVTCAALALAKVTLPVIKAGYLQRRRGHGGKPWLGVLCAVCLSLLVECCSLLHQLLMQMPYRSVLRGTEVTRRALLGDTSVPICVYLLTVLVTGIWYVYPMKSVGIVRSSSLCLEFGCTPVQPHYANTSMILAESLLSGTGWSSNTL